MATKDPIYSPGTSDSFGGPINPEIQLGGRTLNLSAGF
jgi:hypothetical protein